jgi:diguanylate cyclase (GGDEF)-like protein/PAS domain S-box-containing protein
VALSFYDVLVGGSLFASPGQRGEEIKVSNTENTPSHLPSDASTIFPNGEKIHDSQQQEQVVAQRVRQQTLALVALARSKTIERGDLKAALEEITEVAADILEVERASVWLYTNDSPSQTTAIGSSITLSEWMADLKQQRSQIRCFDLYERTRGSHTSGMELVAAEYPDYFQALAGECTIAANNAQTDPRTWELSESYLVPNGITSMLDAPIWLKGEMVGIVCHEHIGVQRQWTPIEENFVSAIATLVALTMEACDRILTQNQLRQYHQTLLSEYHGELERLVEERTRELTKANEQLQQEIDRRSSVEAQLRKYQHHLEELVAERTREIVETNEQLQQEIARHQLAQEALRESEEQFRCLSEATFEAVLISDRGNLVRANSNFTTLFGYEPSEAIGKSVLEFVAPADRFRMQQIVAANSEQMYEILCLTKDRTMFPAEVRSKAIPYQGHMVAVTAIRDITVQARTQEELKKSVSLLHATLNSTTDGIVAVNLSEEIVSFNQKFIEMWGISEEIAIAPNPQERFRFFQEQLKEPETFLRRVRQLYAQPEVEGYDLLELKDGRIFERFTQPQRSDRQIIGRVWIFRDITQRAQAEAALRQHLRQEQVIAVMRDRIRQSLNLGDILKTTVEEVRQFLQTDRVLIYRFQPNWSGTVVVESVASEYMSILGRTINDPCFGELQIQPYQQGGIQAITDIYTAELTPCHVQFLEQFQVRANLVVPILQGDTHQATEGDFRVGKVDKQGKQGKIYSPVSPQLPLLPLHQSTSSPKVWGLLIAHHCSGQRQWQPLEIDLLKSLATQVAIAIQQSSLFEQLEAANRELQRLACMDGLTQVANRRRFDEYLDAEWRRLAREEKPLSLILCDVDYFKAYNDTYGHLAGDFCLQQIASVLGKVLKRPSDLVARYGGEEFAVIVPNTNTTGGLIVAQAIREGVRELAIPHRASLVSQYVTLSLGIATAVPTLDASPFQLIAAADRALYQAKAEGRDRAIASPNTELRSSI